MVDAPNILTKQITSVVATAKLEVRIYSWFAWFEFRLIIETESLRHKQAIYLFISLC